MKRSLNLGLAALCAIGLPSCSSYYISTVSGSNIQKDMQNGFFKLENDTVAISYSFTGENAPVKINVRNKLTVPLYVDWSRSSLIHNGIATGYLTDSAGFSGTASTLNGRHRYVSNTEINERIEKSKETSFIPPNTSIESKTVFINSPVFKRLPDTVFTTPDYMESGIRRIKVMAGNFSRENSPVVFRSYLTLFTNKGEPDKAFAIDREFYISKSVKSFSKPVSSLKNPDNQGDVFYTTKKSNAGYITAGLILGVGLIWAVGAQADAATSMDWR